MAKVKDKNHLPKIKKQIQNLAKKEIKTGVFNPGTLRYTIAAVHEYGTNIGVTGGMRNWFLAQGYPLPSDMTHITIPERSFIRSTFDQEQDEMVRQSKRAVGFMLDGDWDEQQVARTIGAYVVDRIRQRVESQFVMRTGELRDSIQYKVE